MKLVLSVALSSVIIVGAALFTAGYVSSDPSTAVLDSDILAVQQQISDAEDEAAAYAGGAIQGLALARVEVLKTTLAMLEQKRSSWLRRIDLQYTVDGQEQLPDETLVAAIENEIVAAEQERDRSTAEAAQYSGGLIQSLALMKAATSEMTVAQLRMSLLGERYGFVFKPARETAQPVGQEIVEDDEAL